MVISDAIDSQFVTVGLDLLSGATVCGTVFVDRLVTDQCDVRERHPCIREQFLAPAKLYLTAIDVVEIEKFLVFWISNVYLAKDTAGRAFLRDARLIPTS